MFASLFRKQTSARMNRCGSPRRARLSVENLEDRTVPSTMMSSLGLADNAAHLSGGALGGVTNQRTEQASLFGGAMGGVTNQKIEQVSLFGGALGGVTNQRTEQASPFGGALGGVTNQKIEHVSVSASEIDLLGHATPNSLGDHIGEEIPQIPGGAGVDYRQIEQASVSASDIDVLGHATPNSFGGSRADLKIGEEMPA